MSSTTEYWVATGDVEIDKQGNLNPRRATEVNYKLPHKEKLPENTYENLIEVLREGLQEAFDHPGSRAPLIPAYENRDDAASRARLLREHGQDSSEIILVHPRHPSLVYYRNLHKYAEIVSYHGLALSLPTGKVCIIWEPLSRAHVVRKESA